MHELLHLFTYAHTKNSLVHVRRVVSVSFNKSVTSTEFELHLCTFDCPDHVQTTTHLIHGSAG